MATKSAPESEPATAPPCRSSWSPQAGAGRKRRRLSVPPTCGSRSTLTSCSRWSGGASRGGSLQPALWGGGVLVRNWGRIGTKGRLLQTHYENRSSAQELIDQSV